MQSVRVNNRLPQVYRIYRSTPSTPARNMALFHPRFVVNEFAPVFRFLDELQGVSRASRCGPQAQKFRSFQPRFDVTENKDSYELKGELPGIEQKNIEVAFTDVNTLTIRGHTESYREEGTKPSEQVEAKAEQAEAIAGETEKAAATESQSETDSYHKASVEDEDFEHVSESDATMSGANPDATPTETPKETPKQEVAEAAKTERSRRWVSERSVGRFSRTFSFPNRIDQESVSASLKNGILSIVVPKAAVPENKRIEIQ